MRELAVLRLETHDQLLSATQVDPGPVQLAAGDTVNGWEVVCPLRLAPEWGVADVFLVRRYFEVGVLQQAVLKIAGFGLTDITNQQSRLFSVREVEVLRLLAPHSRLPQVFDQFTIAGRHAFVREYVGGHSLNDIIRQQGPLPWRLAAELGLDLMWTIAYAQAREIANRDVKPDNVRILHRRAVLFDWGIAAGAARPAPPDWRTGTPGFSLPEQLLFQEEHPGADIWSWAATMYFTLAGTEAFPPQANMSNTAMMSEARGVRPLPRTVPRALAALIETILRCKAPQLPAADDVICELRALLGRPTLRWEV